MNEKKQSEGRQVQKSSLILVLLVNSCDFDNKTVYYLYFSKKTRTVFPHLKGLAKDIWSYWRYMKSGLQLGEIKYKLSRVKCMCPKLNNCKQVA